MPNMLCAKPLAGQIFGLGVEAAKVAAAASWSCSNFFGRLGKTAAYHSEAITMRNCRWSSAVADGATIRAEIRISQPGRREKKMQGFKSVGSAKRFLSTHATTYNAFNVLRHLTSARKHRAFRASAMQAWREVVAAA